MSNVISLDSITRVRSAAEMRAALSAPTSSCSTSSADGGTSCGSSDGPGDMPEAIWNKVKDHPCYSEEAHHYFARMHVAVAPACNIQCNYCNRKYDCSNESRPGVVSEKLTPEDAALKVMHVAREVPQLSVIGIAGPGDALANPHKTFPTFDLIAKHNPDLKLCLSTNGLALPDHVETIKRYNVDHVTVTINMVDPEIGALIYPWIFYKHKRWHGVEAARILHERQMEGLEMLTSAGILVKVNSVMIPGINDQHLLEVNAAVKKRGAFLHNVMPLISEAEHGTYFGLNGQRGPDPDELMDLQEKLSGGAKLMKHCRQCRADAVGLLGEDRGAEFTLDKLAEMPDPDALVAETEESRRAYREIVERERADRRAATDKANSSLKATPVAVVEKKLVAIATKGGGRINQHFGHANEFQIYAVDADGVTFVGHRKVEQYCEGGFGEADTLGQVIDTLKGVHAVLCAKIGHCPQEQLAEAGLIATDRYAFDYIESSIVAWFQDTFTTADAEPALTA